MYIPLRQIINTLELLGNSFLKRGDLVDAVTSLEVACSLMETLPLVQLRKSSSHILKCFERLKSAYLEAQPAGELNRFDDYMMGIRVPFARLRFEFNYKDIQSNASAEPAVLENFLRDYISTYRGPTAHIAGFLASDVLGTGVQVGVKQVCGKNVCMVGVSRPDGYNHAYLSP